MAAVENIIGFALLFDVMWTIFWLWYLGLDSWHMNRQIKDADHPSPDELRNRAVIISQLALMGLVNVTASAVAGIGASLFVDGGRFRWPSSQVPYTLIIIAASLTEVFGVIIGAYISRPVREWVYDTSDFRSYLRQVKSEGFISETDLVEIRKRRERWNGHTKVSPLRRRPHELTRLGLELPRAHEEWVSSGTADPLEFGARLRADVTAKQVWRWIWHMRSWKLGIPPFIAGFTIALIIINPLASKLPRVPILFPWLLLIAASFICIALVYLLAFHVGRLDLVMTNRYLALECKQLRDCDHLIGQIEELHRRQQEYASFAGADGYADKLVFRIGRWDLRRRKGRI